MRRATVLAVTGVIGAVAIGALAWRADPAPAPAAVAADDGLTPAIPPADVDRLGGGTDREVIGWDHASERLGRDMPTGRGVPGGLVEAGESYAPNSRDQRLRGVSYILQSGDTGNSAHALGTAAAAFSQTGPAPGVGRVHCYSVNHWLGEGYLRTGEPEPPDDWSEARVFNHSWVAQDAGGAAQVVRRVDWLADQRDILCVVGLNNGQTEIPHLLASAANVLSVGVLSGNHSRGGARIEGEGRCKPELIAPGRLTSFSTPVVTGCVAMLLERADTIAARDEESPDAHAGKSEVIRALLMGGAYKPEEWSPEEGKPLDTRWGAGVVDIDRALVMIDGGHTPTGDTTKRYGWAFRDLARERRHDIIFTITEDQGEACFALCWNRRVAGGTAELRNNQTGESRAVWNNTAGLANFDLELVRTDAGGNERVVAASTSTVDNVEMIYLRELEAGTWTLRVRRRADDFDIDWDYALAWRIEAE